MKTGGTITGGMRLGGVRGQSGVNTGFSGGKAGGVSAGVTGGAIGVVGTRSASRGATGA